MARVVWVGGGLLAASMGCAALSLGPVQGQALMGRPLDVSVPLSLRDGELLADGCASAQVFFAEQAMSSVAVKTTLVPGPSQSVAAVRVQTSLALPETYARVDLQVGCGHGIFRSYVLLADWVTVAPVPAPPAEPVVPAPMTQALPVAAPAAAPATAPNKPHAATTVGRLKPAVARVDEAPVLRAVPRLEMDPAALLADAGRMQPRLRLTAAMSGVSESADVELAQNREMVRMLWKALSDSPEQWAAAALVAQAREAELVRLKAALVTAQQAVASAPPQAPPNETSGGDHNWAVLAGGLLTLLVAVGGLMAALRRQRTGRDAHPPWWESQSVSAEEEDAPAPQPPQPSKGGFLARLKAKMKGRSDTQVPAAEVYPLDIDLDVFAQGDGNAGTDWWSKPVRRGSEARAHTDFTHSALFDNPRSVAAEELFDMQQQVEFFISLGQSDQAIEVLQTHLSGNEGDSPLIYLDLLKLYHEQGRRDEYMSLQVRFNRLFNGSAPDFEGYSTSRRGLERYGNTLRAIQALWPQPPVVELLERSILRNTPGDRSEVFDLEAYRELLLLYGIAREVVDGQAVDNRFPSATEPFDKLTLPPEFLAFSESAAPAGGSGVPSFDLDFSDLDGVGDSLPVTKTAQTT
jgi:hypothetical protein